MPSRWGGALKFYGRAVGDGTWPVYRYDLLNKHSPLVFSLPPALRAAYRERRTRMKLTFLGAAHEVTGSCHYLEACGKKILIDCGMQQGPDEYEHQEVPLIPGDIDYVLLTHAHIDHSGRIPYLAKLGFRGKVYATGATCDLCAIMLRDSAHIQEFEFEWKSRKNKRAGKRVEEPLYTMEDAERALELFVPVRYGEVVELTEDLRVRFTDVGHLLGSASIEVFAEERGEARTIAFSGDIGNLNQPLIRDPQYLKRADYVVMESTYGDRDHEAPPDYARELAEVIQRTFDRGGNVVIPSFAVGRTQELLYFIREIKEKHMVRGYDGFSVYVDSPLAIEATHIFNENTAGYFDHEAMRLIQSGVNPISFDGLKTAVTSEESRAINDDKARKVIISASGMCEAGRIKHHLKHNLWRHECTVVFVGFQAVGTLGRILLEGAETVKIFNEEIDVCAEIIRLEGISGHADRAGLKRWLAALEEQPKRVFIVHGESTVCDRFAALVNDEMKTPATAPDFGACYDLITGECLDHGTKPVERPKPERGPYRPSSSFTRLWAAGQQLLTVIQRNEHGANKDLAKFADQIIALCKKWDR